MGDVWQEIEYLCLTWGSRTTWLADSSLSWKLTHAQKVSRRWGFLPISGVVHQFLLADPGQPHFCPQSLSCFGLRQRHSFCAHVWPLWFICCGAVIIDVTYSTVEKSQEPHRSRAWRKACARSLTICVKGKNIIPSRLSLPGAVDSAQSSRLQWSGTVSCTNLVEI